MVAKLSKGPGHLFKFLRYMHMCMYVCKCMYACIFVCTHVGIYIDIYVCVCMCVYVDICVRVCINNVHSLCGRYMHTSRLKYMYKCVYYN